MPQLASPSGRLCVCIRFTVTLACIHQTISGEGFEPSENLSACFKTEIEPARIPTGDICLTLKSLNATVV